MKKNHTKKAEEKIKEILKAKHNIKDFTTEQEQIVQDILTTTMKNSPVTKWEICAEEYIKDPDKTSVLAGDVDKISEENGVDSYLGAILFNSRIDDKE